MAGAAALAALRAAAHKCRLAAPRFSDEQAVQGLAIVDELRARFRPPGPATLAQLGTSSIPPDATAR